MRRLRKTLTYLLTYLPIFPHSLSHINDNEGRSLTRKVDERQSVIKYPGFVLVVDDIVLELNGRDAIWMLGPAKSTVRAHVAQ